MRRIQFKFFLTFKGTTSMLEMNLQLFYLYNGKNCIKWQGILKPLWQSKQGSLFFTSLYCWACTVLMHLSSSKSSQQNEKTPFIKILAAHCCCYNRLSHAMTLWSSGTDEWGHQSQLPLKRKGFDSLHLFCSVLDPDTKSKHLHITSKCKFLFWSPCLKSGPTLIVEAPKASLEFQKGFCTLTWNYQYVQTMSTEPTSSGPDTSDSAGKQPCSMGTEW